VQDDSDPAGTCACNQARRPDGRDHAVTGGSTPQLALLRLGKPNRVHRSGKSHAPWTSSGRSMVYPVGEGNAAKGIMITDRI
jgi:hypothetical protein